MRILIWILLIYYTLARHELSHSLGVYLLGGKLNEIRLIPGYKEELGFFFGYVSYTMEPHWIVKMLPFFIDTLSIGIGFLIIIYLKFESQSFLRIVTLLLIVSPILDLIYNYQGGFWRESSDVYEVLNLAIPWTVHLFFVGSIIAGVSILRKARKTFRELAN